MTNPTSLTFGPDGRLYVAQADGNVLSYGDQGGVAVDRRQVTAVTGTTLGIAFRPGTHDLYISSTGMVSIARGSAGGSFAAPVQIVRGLPNGRHQNDEIAFTLDGSSFYLGVGSTCDACVERDPRSASIMRIGADGGGQQVFAHGVRNPFGLAVHPQTGELFATDNGRDAPTAGVPDELNVIAANGSYGWPDCWGNGGGSSCGGTVLPIALFQEHSSADGFAFYNGASFPVEYRGNAFVALWGDNAGTPGIGRRVERVVLSQTDGQWHTSVTTFASGFDHPLAVAVSPADGALFVADFGSGRIYRIVWQGG